LQSVLKALCMDLNLVHSIGQTLGIQAIDADLHALAVNIIGKGLHIGKFFVGVQDPIFVPLAFLRVIDIDIGVACVSHAGRDHEIGCLADVLISDLAEEPVPAHWRSGSELCLRGGECNEREQGECCTESKAH
jgi:hypothetical protein